jgi:hypothetical protein
LSGHIFATLWGSSEVFQSCKKLQRFSRLEITRKNPQGFQIVPLNNPLEVSEKLENPFF